MNEKKIVEYAGRCIEKKENDKISYLNAVAKFEEGVWKNIDDPQKLFSGVAQVEFRGPDPRFLKLDDWAVFSLRQKKSRDKFWPVQKIKRLPHLIDISDLGDLEQAKGYLAREGYKTTHASGRWFVKYSDSEILSVELKQTEGKVRLSPVNSKVQVYAFNANSIIKAKESDAEIELYNLEEGISPITTYDWSSDEKFSLRIAKNLVNSLDPRAKDAISWFEEQTTKKDGLISLNVTDILTAEDSLRSGKLIKRLKSDIELLDVFKEAFIKDEHVLQIFKESADRMAEQERERILGNLESELKQEIEIKRNFEKSELEKYLSSHKKAWEHQFSNEETKRINELNESLELKKATEEELIRKTIGEKKHVLEKLVGELELRSQAFGIELVKLKDEAKEIARRIASSQLEENNVQLRLEDLKDQIHHKNNELFEAKKKIAEVQEQYPLPIPPRIQSVETLPEQLTKILEASQLLSEVGKQKMKEFLALMLAGEVPVLYGPGVSDFLQIAEILISKGKSVRMEADPTMITFEDLWVRPGIGGVTSLGRALAITKDETYGPQTTLAVVENIERSGARFWYPSLMERANRGDLPRRLLLCVTIRDTESDEAREIHTNSPALHIQDVTTPQSALVAIQMIGSGAVGELNPCEPSVDLFKGIGAIASHSKKLGINRSIRIAKVFSELDRMGGDIDTNSLVSLFLNEHDKDHASALKRSSRDA